MAYNDNSYGNDAGNRNVWSSGSRGGKSQKILSAKIQALHILLGSRGGYSSSYGDNDGNGSRGE